MALSSLHRLLVGLRPTLALKKALRKPSAFPSTAPHDLFPYNRPPCSGPSNYRIRSWLELQDKIVARFALTIYPYSLCIDLTLEGKPLRMLNSFHANVYV
jgi:hypothetical protein